MKYLQRFLFDKCGQFALIMTLLFCVKILFWIYFPTLLYGVTTDFHFTTKNIFLIIEVFIKFFVGAKMFKFFGLQCLQDNYKKMDRCIV